MKYQVARKAEHYALSTVLALILLLALSACKLQEAAATGELGTNNSNKTAANANKVEICHNGETISVSENAYNTHMDHGDYNGECDQEDVAAVFTPDDDFSASTLATTKWAVSNSTAGTFNNSSGVFQWQESDASQSVPCITHNYQPTDSVYEVTLDVDINSTSVNGSGLTFITQFDGTPGFCGGTNASATLVLTRDSSGNNSLSARTCDSGTDSAVATLNNPGYDLALKISRSATQVVYSYNDGSGWAVLHVIALNTLPNEFADNNPQLQLCFGNPASGTVDITVDNFSFNDANYQEGE